MNIRLGYVSISKILDITPSKTITYKEFKKYKAERLVETFKELDSFIYVKSLKSKKIGEFDVNNVEIDNYQLFIKYNSGNYKYIPVFIFKLN